MVTLRISGIDCYYGSIKALDNVTFSSREGEFAGILGPNGSGKTTLLKAISRTLTPRVGTVFLDDINIYDMKIREVAKNVAVVPQEAVATFDFTALDVVLMGRNPYIDRFRMESREDLAVAKRVMELTNTWDLADRPVNELSGGEKQLVIIARALTQEPKVLLLDEPTTHLDISHQISIMDILRGVCKEKKLVVLAVFHDFNLATRYCDSAMLLNNGSIFSIGPIDTVLTGENIKKVFRVDMIVKRHPITESLYVVPLSISRSKITQSKDIIVHMICGHGTGAPLMKLLLEHGYGVTTGVHSTLDTDYDAACTLGIPVVSEAPFSPITEENHKANLAMIDEASAIVVSNVPFGFGNLKNLEAAKVALERGKMTVIVEETPIQQRDFTDGKAQSL
ncbi:MAG: ABC transporter ATP-binding protein, partial [Candidatus Bathyarchaeota archaeon]|nr:ABC transporter ATP-binding protein [Candidatus Bathyarchaeota archaeon]